MLMKNIQQIIDWSLVDAMNYLQAMETSPVNNLKLDTLLKRALTDNIQ